MDDRKTNNKTLILTIGIILTILIIGGGTLAYWSWTTNESEKTNVVFTLNQDFSCAVDGGGDINETNAVIVPTTCTNSEHVIKREVTVTPNLTRDNLNIDMDVWIKVNSIDSKLSNSKNFMYALTTGDTSCTDGVISTGNFNSTNANSQLQIIDKNFSSSTSETYYLWIWLDAAETSSETMNQTFNLTLGGQCTDTGILGDAYALSYGGSLYFFRSETEPIIGQCYIRDETRTVIDECYYDEDYSVDEYYGIYINEFYSGFENEMYASDAKPPWTDDGITSVFFDDYIMPISTSYWFSGVEDIVNLSKLNTSHVVNMSGMFTHYDIWNGNLDLSNFDVSNVIDMSDMFNSFGAWAGDVYLNLSGWNTSKVTDMSGMFAWINSDSNGSVVIDGLDEFNTSNVKNMSSMFRGFSEASDPSSGATVLDIGDISGWDTSKVTNMSNMFINPNAYMDYTLDLSRWNVSSVTDHTNFNTGLEDTIISPNFK